MTMALLAHVVVLALLASAAAYDNGLGVLPPMGWNTWCTDDICGKTRPICLLQLSKVLTMF